MTLQERRVIWEARRREARIRRMRKAAVISASVLLFAIIFSVAFSGFSRSVRAEEKILYKYYTTVEILPGETLTSIAKDHITGYESVADYIDEVKFMNHISDINDIKAGTKIHIPYYSEEYKD